MNNAIKIVMAIVGVGAIIAVFVFATNNEPVADTDNNQPTAVENDTNNNTQPPTTDTDTNNSETDRTYDVTMSNYSFSEPAITAKPGETVTVNLSVDNGTHDFVIDELGVASQIIGGNQTNSVTFTIPEDVESGTTYTYYCSVSNHRQLGMEGQLTISE